MRIAFVGWWTWWHIFPVKALVEYILKNKKLINWDLQEDNLKIFRIWEKDSLEQKIAEDLGIEFYPILSWKIRRYLSLLSILQNFFDLRTNKSALWEIRQLAFKIYENLPNEHKYLFDDYIHK